MNQDDIYNLLLLILLMSNSHDDCDNDCLTRRGSLNELILASLLLNSCNGGNNRDASGRSSNSCGRICNNNENTTF